MPKRLPTPIQSPDVALTSGERMTRISRVLAVLSIPMLLSTIAVEPAAQSPVIAQPAKLFGVLQWRNLGPARGGRSVDVAGREARTDEDYFGVTGGGLRATS